MKFVAGFAFAAAMMGAAWVATEDNYDSYEDGMNQGVSGLV